MVSVPWVMTMPSTSSLASSALTALASVSHTSSFMSWEPILTTCSPALLGHVIHLGRTAAIRVSMCLACLG